MTDQQPRLRESVFAKLVTIMGATALCLLVVVTLLFVLLTQDVHDLIDRDAAHLGLLALFLFVVVGVVLVAHLTLRRLLEPVRVLNDGVARLGRGELDVRLPRTTPDEFGRLTDAFNEMAERVRDMVVSRDQLLIDVSHELRSPLTRMKVALELMSDGDQRARLAGDVVEMERLVTALLEFERLRTPGGISRTREDLIPILREVARKFEGGSPSVRVAPSTAELFLDIDGEKVSTVLRNLLDNAVKYSLPDSRPVEVSATETGAAVVVRVTDDGLGIPDGEAARLFEPFYRVDRSRSKSTGGYGLGLSICNRVMQAHGGSIAVERCNGRGTSFVLTFPKND